MEGLRLTHIGGPTVLIEVGGWRILTDPTFDPPGRTYKFGWGPKENGWSLFTVGVMAAIVQGGLMKQLLKRFSAQRLAALGLVTSTVCYLAWGLATQTRSSSASAATLPKSAPWTMLICRLMMASSSPCLAHRDPEKRPACG